MNKVEDTVPVKQNVNFLEFPIWSINKRDTRAVFSIETKHGVYTYRANPLVGIPDFTDMDILYYLLKLSQQNNSNTIHLTFYDICKNLNLTRTPEIYKRIEKSFDRWEGVSIKFNGNYYHPENKNRVTAGFHILRSTIEESKSKKRHQIKDIKIEIYKEFLASLNVSGLFDMIDMKVYFKLRNPLSKRLYEYLPKHFADKKKYFEISDNLLFDKLRLRKRKYRSEIVRQFSSIKLALAIYNDSQDKHNFSFSYTQKKNSKTDFLCVFYKNIVYKKSKQIQANREQNPAPIKKQPEPTEVPLNIDKELYDGLVKHGITHEQISYLVNNPDIEMSNILDGYTYFKRQLDDGAINKNPSAYLYNSIIKGWGKRTPEELANEKKQKEIESARTIIKENKLILDELDRDRSTYLDEKSDEIIKSLVPVVRDGLEKECVAQLSDFEKKIYNPLNKLKPMKFKSFIRERFVNDTDEEILDKVALDKGVDIVKVNKLIEEAQEVLRGYGVPYTNQ